MHFLPLPIFLPGSDKARCHGRVEYLVVAKRTWRNHAVTSKQSFECRKVLRETREKGRQRSMPLAGFSTGRKVWRG